MSAGAPSPGVEQLLPWLLFMVLAAGFLLGRAWELRRQLAARRKLETLLIEYRQQAELQEIELEQLRSPLPVFWPDPPPPGPFDGRSGQQQ